PGDGPARLRPVATPCGVRNLGGRAAAVLPKQMLPLPSRPQGCAMIHHHARSVCVFHSVVLAVAFLVSSARATAHEALALPPLTPAATTPPAASVTDVIKCQEPPKEEADTPDGKTPDGKATDRTTPAG